jgi:lipoate-protein ligase A
MALDDALLERARTTGERVARVYSWSSPTLSFGRNQVASGTYDPERLRARRIDVVRRPTGGRAVLHHREITYSVTAPASDEEPIAESYARINRLLLDGLRRLGVRAALATPEGRARMPGTAPCFETPAQGELVIDGRKLVGSAQYRERGALLQHGSILIDDDQSVLGELTAHAIPSAPPAATLRDALGHAPSPGDFADVFFASVRSLEDPGARQLERDTSLAALVECAAVRYRDARWTWRR